MSSNKQELNQLLISFSNQSSYAVFLDILIEQGADVEAKTSIGNTPLMLAAAADNKKLVKILIANGADLNATNNKGENALFIAFNLGLTDVAQIIQKKMHKLKAIKLENKIAAKYQAGNNPRTSLLWQSAMASTKVNIPENLKLPQKCLEAIEDAKRLNN